MSPIRRKYRKRCLRAHGAIWPCRPSPTPALWALARRNPIHQVLQVDDLHRYFPITPDETAIYRRTPGRARPNGAPETQIIGQLEDDAGHKEPSRLGESSSSNPQHSDILNLGERRVMGDQPPGAGNDSGGYLDGIWQAKPVACSQPRGLDGDVFVHRNCLPSR